MQEKRGRSWTDGLLGFVCILALMGLIAVAVWLSVRTSRIHAASVEPERKIVKMLTTLPSGLGFEWRYNSVSLECFQFLTGTPAMTGWQMVDACPPTATQVGGPPYYGEAHVTMPQVVHVDAVRLWPLDFMPQDFGCIAGGLVFVRADPANYSDTAPGRLYVCDGTGWRQVLTN